MRGTIVCAVTDSDEGRGALAVAAELSERLGLRLVLAHVAEGIAPLDINGEGTESVTTRADREGAARLIARLAAEQGVVGNAAAFGCRRPCGAARSDRSRGGRRPDRRRVTRTHTAAPRS